jgi:hypothetical protein
LLDDTISKNHEKLQKKLSLNPHETLKKHEIDIVAIKETNKTSGMNLLNRGKLPKLKLVCVIHSNVHGIVKYIRNTLAERFGPTPIFVGGYRLFDELCLIWRPAVHQ